ncbi:MAG TPA: beta-L-arabinofuranosidase domain-containing protein [Micromonosporaceae bacterium]|nr:beta-L-arabinofuranosidase domain-containing protein [Micromonosporaceae bacterium]
MTAPNPVKGPVSPLATGRLAVRPLGLDQVEVTGGFFGEWQQRNRDVTAPHALGWLERDGSVDNLRRLGAGEPADAHRGMWFSDSDVHKVLEALSWELGRSPSPSLDQAVTDLTAILRAAQRPDGYLNSYVQEGFDVRWDNLVMSHELYCIGHLIQAGVAHHRATGREDLLDVARRAADCVVRDFGDSQRKDTDGHPVIETALVELYRQTGERAYLDLALQLVNVRGYGVLNPNGHFDSAYYQDATPVRMQTTVVGHAVRALYLLSGIVDLYVETGEQALLDSALRQWASMSATKLYLTGAVGSRFEGEAFGDEYELPPDLVYGETCATIASMMVAWRLLLATGESRFADAMERALYNLVAASTSVTRDGFFYNNPAQRRTARPPAAGDGRQQRAEAPGTRPAWFNCACCPPNIMRTVASLAAYAATYTHAGVQVHQFLPTTITAPLAHPVGLTVSTDYPVDGRVTVAVTDSGDDEWTLALRVPGWCRDPQITVNGAALPATPNERGYVEVTRVWRAGDGVVYTMPMPVRFTLAHPAVDAVHGMVAVERGPVVYCLESPDQPADVDLNRVELLVDREPTEEVRDGVAGERAVVVKVPAMARDDSAWSRTGWATLGEAPAPQGHEVELVAIPYHLWANRGPSVMRIFTPMWAARSDG